MKARHEHNWKISSNQQDTGTNGVRKYCTGCQQEITFYTPRSIKEMVIRQTAAKESE